MHTFVSYRILRTLLSNIDFCAYLVHYFCAQILSTIYILKQFLRTLLSTIDFVHTIVRNRVLCTLFVYYRLLIEEESQNPAVSHQFFIHAQLCLLDFRFFAHFFQL